MPKKQPIKPMLATSAKAPVTSKGWLFEIQWDGYRVIATVEKGKASLSNINGDDLTNQFKLITNELEGQPDMAIDGEVVVLDDNGKPDFSLLESYAGKGDLVYYVFDLLSLEGESYLNRPLIQRKEMLLHVLKKESILTYNDDFTDGRGLFEQVSLLGLEGIVCKRKGSIYEPGFKSKDWIAVKAKKEASS